MEKTSSKLGKLFFALSTAGLVSALTGCDSTGHDSTGHDTMPSSEVSESTAIVSPNQTLLDEVNGADGWFHAKKTRPIWARQAAEDQTLTTLEGEEAVSAGDYLCRGEAGDVWPQKEEKLLAKYQATDTVEDGWRFYTPNPDSMGVMAARVDHTFTIEATWGTLSGKSGDFAVKSFEDSAVAYPEDVWIVDQALFRATYARVETDTPTDSSPSANGES